MLRLFVASWVLSFVVLTACGSSETSLEGSIECGMSTCGTGEVCVTQPAGIDASTPPPPGSDKRCTAANNCSVSDCAGNECAPCLIDLCGCTQCLHMVVGREVFCLGQ